MRTAAALALLAALSGAPHDAECTLNDARYIQPHSPWVLTFHRVPRYGAPTQIAAFALELPNSGVTLDGSINGSMGFGSPLWSIEGKCSPDSLEICRFLSENQSPAAYGMYDGEIRFLDSTPGAAAPEHLILPQLTAGLWYSQYREDEWDGDEDHGPGDAFVLEGCD